MATLKKSEQTRHEIVKAATRLFLECGYTKTSPQMIAKELGMSTGNLTYHYPAKEHLLLVLVEMLCAFQRELMALEAGEGISTLLSICLELMTMAAACEEDEAIKDFFISSYQSPLCLGFIRTRDCERSKEAYAQFCEGWTHEQFVEAETLVSGIEYATLQVTADSASLETRVSGALNQIMAIYNVPEELRQEKIQKTLALDYRELSRTILNEFKKFVENKTEE